MSDLRELFPEGPRGAHAAVVDDHHSLDQLHRMFGAPSDVTRRNFARTDVAALAATVAAARKDAAPLPMPKGSAPRGRRGRKLRVDPVNLVAGAIAALAVAALVIFGGAQVANANPAASALRGLEADEAQLENSADIVRGVHDRVAELLDAARTEAAEYRAMLDSTAPVTDRHGQQIDIVDAAARAAAISEADGYKKALDDFTIPTVPADYERGDIDEHSLEDIAEAVDRTQAQLAEWAEAKPVVDDARAQLQPLIETHEANRISFSKTFETAAAALVEEYGDLPPELHDAVALAAADVVASKLAPGAGASLTAYRAAVTTLVTTEPVVIPPPPPVITDPAPPAPDEGDTNPEPPETEPTDAPVPPEPTEEPVDPDPTQGTEG